MKDDVIKKEIDSILNIKKRLFLIQDLQKELSKRVGTKKFNVYNDRLWHMILDYRDMLVIDLASWSRSTVQSKGFWNKAKGQGLCMNPISTTGDTSLDSIIKRARYEASRLLFGRIIKIGAKLTHQEIDDLKDRFYDKVVTVIDDRDANRAHRYEDVKKKGTAKMLNIQQIEDIFKYAESIFKNIYLFNSGHNTDFNDIGFSNSKDTAEEIIDIVMYGTKSQQKILKGR